MRRVTSIETHTKDEVKSLATTINDTKLLIAVGYKSGTIELYDVTGENIQMTQRLKCHKEPVNFLVFSPPAIDNIEGKALVLREKLIVLASISEEICFWNVTHALNNPMERDNQLRLSQRISRKLNSNRVNAHVAFTNGNNNVHNVTELKAADSVGNANCCSELEILNPWIGKTGTSEKPELLSCIKFVGSSAEKLYANEAFNTFITVDNEGVIYFLRANNQLNEI